MELLRTKAATRARRIRGIRLPFIGRQSPTTIFLLSFMARGRHFSGLAGAGIPRVRAVPAGKTGAAGDQASAALVREIRPRPLHEDEHAVLETNQEKNVNEQPSQPGHESRDVYPAELRDGRGAADGGEAAFVEVVERRAGHGFRRSRRG